MARKRKKKKSRGRALKRRYGRSYAGSISAPIRMNVSGQLILDPAPLEEVIAEAAQEVLPEIVAEVAEEVAEETAEEAAERVYAREVY